MGLMRWMRGGDEDTSATSVISAGLAEIDGLFRPSKHKQTEHVEASKRRRVDVKSGAGVDLEQGLAVVRARPDDPDDVTRPARAPRAARTPYQPRRRTWWTRMKIAMRRRRRARRAAAGTD